MANIPTNGEVNFNIIFNGGDGEEPTTDNESEGTPAAPINDGKPSKKDSSSSKAKNVAVAAGVNTALSLGKKAVNSAISSIGLATGDYATQQKVQDGLNVASTAAGLIASCSSIYTFVAAVGAFAISTGVKLWQEAEQNKWENRKAANYAKLYGFASNEGR